MYDLALNVDSWDLVFHNNDLLLIDNAERIGQQIKITLADGKTATFGGGDLVVNGISLTKHLHTGVTPGGGNTGKPI